MTAKSETVATVGTEIQTTAQTTPMTATTTTTTTSKRDASAQQQQQQEDGKRETWTNDWEFVMSCIALSIGLGNVWRFPFVALENGGGAFLIPYLIVLVLIGQPIYYLELLVGQFSSRSSIKVYDMVPAFRGTYRIKKARGHWLLALKTVNFIQPLYSHFEWTKDKRAFYC